MLYFADLVLGADFTEIRAGFDFSGIMGCSRGEDLPRDAVWTVFKRDNQNP